MKNSLKLSLTTLILGLTFATASFASQGYINVRPHNFKAETMVPKLNEATVFFKEITPHNFALILKEFIGPEEIYKDALDKIGKLTSQDRLIVGVDGNSGGFVNTGNMITDALDNTKADTYLHLTTNAASMAADITCHIKHLKVDSDATLLFHTGSMILPAGAYTAKDLMDISKLNLDSFKRMSQSCVKNNILTAGQVEDLAKYGHDLILEGKDIHNTNK